MDSATALCRPISGIKSLRHVLYYDTGYLSNNTHHVPEIDRDIFFPVGHWFHLMPPENEETTVNWRTYCHACMVNHGLLEINLHSFYFKVCNLHMQIPKLKLNYSFFKLINFCSSQLNMKCLNNISTTEAHIYSFNTSKEDMGLFLKSLMGLQQIIGAMGSKRISIPVSCATQLRAVRHFIPSQFYIKNVKCSFKFKQWLKFWDIFLFLTGMKFALKANNI